MTILKSLSAIYLYPVKGCKGISLSRVAVGPKGPALDRRWMVIDANGRFLSQRQVARMALIEILLKNETVIIRIPHQQDFEISQSLANHWKEVVIWRDTCRALDVGDAIAEKLSQFLETPCRLVFMPDETLRQVDQKYAIAEQDVVGFADGFPFLLISQASLDDLNQRLAKQGHGPLPMNRFRPNLVISGCEPYEEDTWKWIRIGQIRFKVAKPCSRCVVTAIDQQTGEKGLEPLQILATYRKQEKGIMFGQNLVHASSGTLNEGDAVEVLKI